MQVYNTPGCMDPDHWLKGAVKNMKYKGFSHEKLLLEALKFYVPLKEAGEIVDNTW